MNERDYVVHDDKNVRGFFYEYRWLSNFHLADVFFDGVRFPATENAYVYAKMPEDLREHRSALVQELVRCTPKEAKRLGREQVPLRRDWEQVKFDVMSSVVFDKFYRHPDLRYSLVMTGSKYLEETNGWGDQYWGVCDGIGQNMLGKILMRVRDFWSAEYPPERRSVKLF